MEQDLVLGQQTVLFQKDTDQDMQDDRGSWNNTTSQEDQQPSKGFKPSTQSLEYLGIITLQWDFNWHVRRSESGSSFRWASSHLCNSYTAPSSYLSRLGKKEWEGNLRGQVWIRCRLFNYLNISVNSFLLKKNKTKHPNTVHRSLLQRNVCQKKRPNWD